MSIRNTASVPIPDILHRIVQFHITRVHFIPLFLFITQHHRFEYIAWRGRAFCTMKPTTIHWVIRFDIRRTGSEINSNTNRLSEKPPSASYRQHVDFGIRQTQIRRLLLYLQLFSCTTQLCMAPKLVPIKSFSTNECIILRCCWMDLLHDCRDWGTWRLAVWAPDHPLVRTGVQSEGTEQYARK